MIIKPTSKTIAKRGDYGIVGTSGPAGSIVRRMAFPVQTGAKAQVAWRQVFSTAKRNYAARATRSVTASDGGTYTEAQMWMAANEAGPTQWAAGDYEGVEQLTGKYLPCAAADAYYTMCETMRTNLGMSAPDAPIFTTSYLALEGLPVNPSGALYELYVLGYSTPCTNYPPLRLVLNFFSSAEEAPPSAIALSVADCIAEVYPTSFPYDSGGSMLKGQRSLSETPVSGGYMWTATAIVRPKATTGTGTKTATLTWTDGQGAESRTFSVVASSGNQQVSNPPPTFDAPYYMTSHTIYDSSYTPTGFSLAWKGDVYTTFPMWIASGTPFGGYSASLCEVPGVWEIIASDQYTDSYSAPAASTWQPILFYGPYMPGYEDILAAWADLYGDPYDSGRIKFQAVYIDPFTGATGATLSCTASWEVGTLRGFLRSAWSGPIFNWHTAPADATLTCPGTVVQTLAVYGENDYAGTITFTFKSATKLPTGKMPEKKTIPSGVTAEFSPTSITITAGDTAVKSTTMTITGASGAEGMSGTFYVVATDAVSTTSKSFVLDITGDTVDLPPVCYLSVAPRDTSLSFSSSSVETVVFTLSNSGSSDIDAVMEDSPTYDNVETSWDNPSVTVPAQTSTSYTAAPISTAFGYADGVSGSCNYWGTFKLANSFAGWYLSASGASGSGVDGGPWEIVANTTDTITCLNPNNPSMDTSGGELTLTNPNSVTNSPAPALIVETPGTASATLTITEAAAPFWDGLALQIEANGGVYYDYAVVWLNVT